ncbi:nitronate monooxygenase [Humitalea rosea]|uniref:Nitronate monooxygenase n=1 Tax=Humitalea rosea TaxID=990373 RepID=A0A2W7IRJ8_9PROT|nr:nitronate monooxygenase [Humitalea rosea]PZW48111.1 nitronate monooxygenase [Humitalea rosea]
MNQTGAPQRFRTRITELFGIRHPILAGGLMWLSDADYVAAVVNAGGMGFITSRSFASVRVFQAELERCAALTGGVPFGVNLSTSRHTDVPLMAYLQAALDQGVRFFETSGRAPADALIAAIHAAGALVIHKVPLLRYGLSAERLGVDAVALVGMECGGHPGVNLDVPAMLGGAIAQERLRLPYAIGGGIGTGRQLLAALALGADAVVIGTRFLAAAEVNAHPAYKQRVIAAGEDDSLVAFAGNQPMGGAWRVMANATARTVRTREAAGLDGFDVFSDLLRGTLSRDGCYRDGDTDSGMLSMGPAACFVDRVAPMSEIIDHIITEAVQCRERIDRLMPALAPA